MNIPIEEVEALLLEKKVEVAKVQEIIRDLTKVAEELKEDRKENSDPKQKWEFLVVINDPDKTLKQDYVAWVVQQRDGQDSGLMLSKLTDAAKAQNEAAKRKKTVIKSFLGLFECVKSKFTKERGIRIKTKEPVRVLVVNGNTL
jgi:citrate lyase beta subunit